MLLERLTGAGDEEQMPKDDPPLPPAEIALIARWIDEGVRETPSGPPAPAPWVAPLTLERPAVPAAVWPDWAAPADRLVADYLRRHGQARPALIDDARFARRVHLDLWGLLPTPEQLRAFLDDPKPDKRARLVRTLLADGDRYAEHWMSFWNDCSATRTASPTSRRTPAARASRRGCSRRCATTCPTTVSSRR